MLQLQEDTFWNLITRDEPWAESKNQSKVMHHIYNQTSTKIKDEMQVTVTVLRQWGYSFNKASADRVHSEQGIQHNP